MTSFTKVVLATNKWFHIGTKTSNLFTYYGNHSEVIAYNGPRFSANDIKQQYWDNDIHHLHTTPLHPQGMEPWNDLTKR